MPSHYAHYYFGKEIIRKLSDDDRIKKTVNMNGDSLDAFMIALQGPDILAFYKPYSYNSLNREGVRIHRSAGNDFFERAVVFVRDDPSPEKFSYLFGFMCHYMLDSACHPLVKKYMDVEDLSHSKIERDFDSYLLRMNDGSPFDLDTDVFFPVNPDLGRIASSFYHSAGPRKLNEAIRSMRKYLGLLSSDSRYLRAFEYTLLSNMPIDVINDKADMVATKYPSPLSTQSNVALYRMLNAEIDDTIAQINFLLDSIIDDKPLNERLELDFMGDHIL